MTTDTEQTLALPKELSSVNRSQLVGYVVEHYHAALLDEQQRLSRRQAQILEVGQHAAATFRGELESLALEQFAKVIDQQKKLLARVGYSEKTIDVQVSIHSDGFSTGNLRDRSVAEMLRRVVVSKEDRPLVVFNVRNIGVNVIFLDRASGARYDEKRTLVKIVVTPKLPKDMAERHSAMRDMAKEHMQNEERLFAIREQLRNKSKLQARVSGAITERVLENSPDGQQLIAALRSMGMLNGGLHSKVKALIEQSVITA